MLRIFFRLTNNLLFIVFYCCFWDFLPKRIRKLYIQNRLNYITNNSRKLKFYNGLKSNELKYFPFVSKTIIKENINFNYFKDKAIYGSKFTSGSSGVPFEIPKWKFSDLLEFLVGERAFYRVIGYKFRPKVLVLRSFSPKPGEKITKYSFLRNWYYYSPYHINKLNLKTLLDYYKKVKPTILKGYPSTIFSFTSLLLENNIKLDSPKLIFTSSETFPKEWRKVIENYWSCPVIDWYGQNERTVIVSQCEYGNYHTNDDYGILEIDKNTNEIIATSLWNDVMPFIKYRTGDIAIELKSPIKCKCKNKGPIQIAGIIGRIDDMLIDGNNDKIPPTNFYSLFEKFNLKGFQILQKKDLSITVMIEGWSNINNMEQLLIKEELISRVKGQKLIIQSVNEIERSSVTNKIKIIKREKL